MPRWLAMAVVLLVSRDAAPRVPMALVDEDVAAAPRWVYRSVEGEHVSTYTLQWHGPHAALEVDDRGKKTYVGDVAAHGAVLAFDVRRGRESMHLECRYARIRVGRAGAVLHEGTVREEFMGEYDCFDHGRWSATRNITVLRCDEMPFARAPGVEQVTLDDDCQSWGYRVIAK